MRPKRRKPSELFEDVLPPAGSEDKREKAGEIIRSVEKLIGERRFEIALEKLSAAQTLDPDNKYVVAIVDRINFLQKEASAQSGNDPSREEIATEVQLHIKEAGTLLKKGSIEEAFKQLMDAYLLDPVDPAVVDFEKSLLPIWEKNHTKETKVLSPSELMDAFSRLNDSSALPTEPVPLPALARTLLSSLDGDQKRELVNQQKEAEVLKRRLAM